MSSYCLKCRKKSKNYSKIQRDSKVNNGKTMILSKCAICGSRKSRFIKKQEASGTLRKLGLKAPLNKIPLFDDILFSNYKMNETCNKFVLAEDNALLTRLF